MGTLESAVGSGSLAESASVNIEVLSSEVSNAAVSVFVVGHFPICLHF